MAFVKTEVQGAVEIITIDRPKALNALNPEVLADLKAAFEAVDQSAIPESFSCFSQESLLYFHVLSSSDCISSSCS